MNHFWQNHQRELERLTPAEQKVADWLRQHEAEAMAISIQALANQAKVSEPTVIRFCRKLGLAGFPALKLQLAQYQDISPRQSLIGYGLQSLSTEDSAELIARKVLHNGREEIEWLDNPDTLVAVEAAAEVLAKAARIECFGLGGSAIPARDAVHKLNRLGKLATNYLSLHDYEAEILRWPADTVLCLFSRNSEGYIPDIVASAQSAGVTTVLIGPVLDRFAEVKAAPSAAAQLLMIKTPKISSSPLESPIKPRTMQLSIIDMICAIIHLKS